MIEMFGREITLEQLRTAIKGWDNKKDITISKEWVYELIDMAQDRKDFPDETNQKWMDTLSEEEVLLNLAGLLYHYDSGTAHDESFSNDEWLDVFGPMIDYVEKRFGNIAFNQKMSNWFRDSRRKLND